MRFLLRHSFLQFLIHLESTIHILRMNWLPLFLSQVFAAEPDPFPIDEAGILEDLGSFGLPDLQSLDLYSIFQQNLRDLEHSNAVEGREESTGIAGDLDTARDLTSEIGSIGQLQNLMTISESFENIGSSELLVTDSIAPPPRLEASLEGELFEDDGFADKQDEEQNMKGNSLLPAQMRILEEVADANGTEVFDVAFKTIKRRFFIEGLPALTKKECGKMWNKLRESRGMKKTVAKITPAHAQIIKRVLAGAPPQRSMYDEACRLFKDAGLACFSRRTFSRAVFNVSHTEKNVTNQQPKKLERYSNIQREIAKETVLAHPEKCCRDAFHATIHRLSQQGIGPIRFGTFAAWFSEIRASRDVWTPKQGKRTISEEAARVLEQIFKANPGITAKAARTLLIQRIELKEVPSESALRHSLGYKRRSLRFA